MKMTAIFLFAGLFAATATNSLAQVGKVTIETENATLSSVFDEIEEQTSYALFYKKDVIDDQRKVSINVEEEELADVMATLLSGENVSYQVMDNSIVIVPGDLGSDNSEGNVQQNEQPIQGTVTDEDGEPLPGVTISIRGTDGGTVTDANGDFSLAAEDDAELVFSFVGFQKQVVEVDGREQLDVVLQEKVTELQEVVAVGYGSMRKENLTGEVANVRSETFQDRQVNNVTQALEGAVPNLEINLVDGKPIRGSEYKIRGETSIGQGGDALILIDGVEGDPDMLNPNDIQDISVLKGASASAIYGARGSFGVILIETKDGADIEEAVSVNYSMSYGIKTPRGTRDNVTDGYTWAKNFDEAYYAYMDYTKHPSSINKTQEFSLDYLEELKERSENPDMENYRIDEDGDYVYYGNTDWYELLYKDNLTTLDHNISVSGNSETMNYYLSGRYQDQEGLFRYNSDDFSSYNFRAKGSVNITDWLSVSNNTSYSSRKYNQPMNVGEGGGIWRNISDEGHPTSLMFNPDGTLTHSSAYTVGDMWYGKNREIMVRNDFRTTTGLTADFFDDDLTIKGDFTYSKVNDDNNRRRVEVPFSKEPGQIQHVGSSYNDLRMHSGGSDYLATNLYGEYENTFNDHYFKLMTGFNYEEKTFESFNAQRNGILYPDAENIDLTVGENKEINGSYYKWRIGGQFFRVNYDYAGRYLVEINGRYDINSKFPSDEQAGFFPSFSFGYRISEEPFWNVDDQFISSLKLRGSYGSLGNGNVDPYTYLELFNINQAGRIIDGKRPSYTSHPSVIPEGLTWEKSTTRNIGVDISFLSDRLILNADMYERETTDMYTTGLPVPAVFGASVPKGNYADMDTRGWEIELSWNDQFTLAAKPFNYSVRVGVSDNTSEITRYNNPDKLLSDYYEGMELGEIWGFETEGLFESEQEIENHADQSYIPVSANDILLPGDVKFKDLNNDGEIDRGNNRVDDHGDLKVIGNSEPRYAFNLNFSGDWNNLNFSAFFHGVGKQDWWPNDESPFWGQYMRPYNDFPKWQLGNRWSEDNPNAYMPRYRGYVAGWGRELEVVQSRYLQDVAFISLKSLQLGYRLPGGVMERISFLSNLEFTLTGENLWNWSPLYDIQERHFDVRNIGRSDPELTGGWNSGNVNNYPMLKTISFGLSATF
ncbi:MAG: TonB-dependent receptor [Bacteroidota bacterium]